MKSSCSVIQTPCNMAVESDRRGALGWTPRPHCLGRPGTTPPGREGCLTPWAHYTGEAPPQTMIKDGKR